MTVRTFAAGLLLGAFFMMKLSVQFLEWVTSVSPAFAFQIAHRTLADNVAHVAGIGLIMPAAFIACCLGIGFAISGIFYPLVERSLFAFLGVGSRSVLLLVERASRRFSRSNPQHNNTI